MTTTTRTSRAAYGRHLAHRHLYERADAAGRAAAEACTPAPMVVFEREHPFDDTSAITKVWPVVMGGACGFAWIVVKPGSSSFARWLKQHREGYTGRSFGGVRISVRGYGQSLERKEAYAHAFAQALRDAGIDAYGQSRID